MYPLFVDSPQDPVYFLQRMRKKDIETVGGSRETALIHEQQVQRRSLRWEHRSFREWVPVPVRTGRFPAHWNREGAEYLILLEQ